MIICLGWNRKIAYCIAFSIDGATDVTRRYVRYPAKHGAERSRASEANLLWIIQEIRQRRREKLSEKGERRRLAKEEEREERELRGYVAQALATEINNLLPNKKQNSSGEIKVPVTTQNGTVEWVDSAPRTTRQQNSDQSQGRR